MLLGKAEAYMDRVTPQCLAALGCYVSPAGLSACMDIRCMFVLHLQAMAGRKPARPEIPETPFGALVTSPGEGTGQRLGTSRLNSRESDKAARQPPIYEDQEHREQPGGRGPQYFSSLDSDRQRRSQLGSKESLARTPEFPSKQSTRASSAGSRCPFLPCHGCMEHCLDTKDAQQHYRPSWVCRNSHPCVENPFTGCTEHILQGFPVHWR